MSEYSPLSHRFENMQKLRICHTYAQLPLYITSNIRSVTLTYLLSYFQNEFTMTFYITSNQLCYKSIGFLFIDFFFQNVKQAEVPLTYF